MLKKADVTVDKWVEEVAKIGFMSAKDIWENVNEHGATIKDWDKIDGSLIAGVEEKQLKDGSTVVEIKTHNKTKNLEHLGKYLGVFSENINVRGAVPIIIRNSKGEVIKELGLGDAEEED